MKNVVILAIAAAVIAVLSAIAAITVTFVPGVAALYPATAFEAAFGAWFGVWGALASYIGLLAAGTGAGWFSVTTGLLLALSDFLVAISCAIGIRTFKIDPSLPTMRDVISFYVVALFLGSVPASLFYNLINLQLGVIAGWNSFWAAVVGWNIGNAIVLLVIGIPLMKIGTSTIKRMGLFIKQYF